jgi:hypothetical protein
MVPFTAWAEQSRVVERTLGWLFYDSLALRDPDAAVTDCF